MGKPLRYGLLVGCLLVTLRLSAQDEAVPLDDLAFVIEQTFNRNEVRAAMQDFHASTGVALSVTTLFEGGVYTAPAQAVNDLWLQNHTYSLSILLTLAPRSKAFRTCQMRVGTATHEWLPIQDRQQIRQDIMEHYFRSTLSPDDACTQGLLMGFRALKERILANQNRSEPWSVSERVREALLSMQEEGKSAEDSLAEAVATQSDALEAVIQAGYFYPPRIKGPNDEFIGEGMSQYAAPVVRTDAERSQMEPIMLELDSVRNALYRADVQLQRTRSEREWIAASLSEEAVAILAEQIAPTLTAPPDLRTVRAAVEQRMGNDLKADE